MKKNIPNLLTSLRILLTPIIIVFGLLSNMPVVITLTIICALTDLIDGWLARRWQVVSETGAKLDAVADKVFAIGLVMSLVVKVPLLIIVLILELIIGSISLFYFNKYNNVKSLTIGKIKTNFLFIMIILVLLTSFNDIFTPIMLGLVYITIILQIITIIKYLLYNRVNPNLEMVK